jgi:hypothetical protein
MKLNAFPLISLFARAAKFVTVVLVLCCGFGAYSLIADDGGGCDAFGGQGWSLCDDKCNEYGLGDVTGCSDSGPGGGCAWNLTCTCESGDQGTICVIIY